MVSRPAVLVFCVATLLLCGACAKKSPIRPAVTPDQVSVRGKNDERAKALDRLRDLVGRLKRDANERQQPANAGGANATTDASEPVGTSGGASEASVTGQASTPSEAATLRDEASSQSPSATGTPGTASTSSTHTDTAAPRGLWIIGLAVAGVMACVAVLLRAVRRAAAH